MLKLLLMSTPVGSLGTGQGGGIELRIRNLAKELQQRGYKIRVVAPQDSILPGVELTTIPGNLQIPVQTQTRNTKIFLPENSVLRNMWDYAHRVQNEYDLIVNFAFDGLPFELTPSFKTPIAHFISMGSMTDALDSLMERIARDYPGRVGVSTQSQADTFKFRDRLTLLSSGIDLSMYQFCDSPNRFMAWSGRISPEKGLEDAVKAANITSIPLKIYGKMQNEDYWDYICRNFPKAPVEYRGFLDISTLQAELRRSLVFLMTPRWVEAFGNVAVEALACGVPVITYDRGGPGEIVKDGETGFVVKPDSPEELVNAIYKIDAIDRFDCRRRVEEEYSLTALGDRFENWFQNILNNSRQMVSSF